MNLCSGPYYRSPCRVFLSDNLGTTFQSCATRRLLALTPKACRSCRIHRCAAPGRVENDAVGEEEAMQRVRQAVMEYAASRVIFVTNPNPAQAPQPSHSPFSTKAVTARKVRLLLGCPLISLPRRVNLFSAHVVLVFNRRNGKTI